MDTRNNILDNEAGNLPDGWEIKKLGDICSKLASGATPTGGDSSYKTSGISLIRSQNVLDFTFSHNGLAFIDDDQAKKLKNVEIQEKDILINITGDSVARCCTVPNKVLPARVNQHVMIIRVNDKTCNIDYIKYYLLNPDTKNYLLSLSLSGATRKALTKIMLENLEIRLPPIEEQKEIAAILSSLDDKIELNQQINKKLEEMAQALFKEWFIDFNFPDENGNPYRDSGGAMIDSELGQIPASWSVGKLGDYVTIKRGGSPRPIQEYLSDCGLRWLKISDATATVAPFIFDIKEFIRESGISKTVLLNKGSLVLSNSATPGIPKILAVDSCIHDGWLYFQNSKFSNEFLYLLFKDIRVQLVQQGNGSVFTNLKTDIVKSHLMAIPDNIVLNKFNELASIVFLQMKSNCQQINNLTCLRNMLLPKLMSGGIKI